MDNWQLTKRDRKINNVLIFLLIFNTALSFVLMFCFFNATELSRLYGYPLVIGILSVMIIILSTNKITKDVVLKNSMEFRWAAFSILIIFNLILILVRLELVEKPIAFNNAKVEWFVVLFSALGFVGALWAILAKIKADKAFNAAERAHFEAKEANAKAQKASEYSMKTYQSIAGAFEFDDILKSDSETMLPFHINRDFADLFLFLGFPAVGMFNAENHSKGKTVNEAMKFCRDLTHKLNTLQSDIDKKLKIRLIFFSKALTKGYLDKALASKFIDDEIYAEYVDVEKDLIEAAKKLKKKARSKPDFFKYAFLEKEVGLRFAISESKHPEREANGKAIVWIVADFELHSEKISQFKSSGFKTSDPEIIKVLRSLCEDYLDEENVKKDLVSFDEPYTNPIQIEIKSDKNQ